MKINKQTSKIYFQQLSYFSFSTSPILYIPFLFPHFLYFFTSALLSSLLPPATLSLFALVLCEPLALPITHCIAHSTHYPLPPLHYPFPSSLSTSALPASAISAYAPALSTPALSMPAISRAALSTRALFTPALSTPALSPSALYTPALLA